MTGTEPEHDDATPDRPAPEQRPLSREEEQAAARARIAQQQTWVDLQVRRAMERGDFDDLPGAGRPIEGLGAEHDPDWWIKGLIERERVVVLPLSVAAAQGGRRARRPPRHASPPRARSASTSRTSTPG